MKSNGKLCQQIRILSFREPNSGEKGIDVYMNKLLLLKPD